MNVVTRSLFTQPRLHALSTAQNHLDFKSFQLNKVLCQVQYNSSIKETVSCNIINWINVFFVSDLVYQNSLNKFSWILHNGMLS